MKLIKKYLAKLQVKFVFSKKATKIDEIFTVIKNVYYHLKQSLAFYIIIDYFIIVLFKDQRSHST